MKVVLVMLVVTAVLLIYQTTSPVRITESMIFSYKHKMLLGEAETVASSLSSSQNLTSQGAEEIMSVLGTRDMGQVVITDGDGVVLYSSNLWAAAPFTRRLFRPCGEMMRSGAALPAMPS